MPAAQRPPVVHVTWQRHVGRAEEVAHALGGQPLHVFYPAMTRKALVPLRYLLSMATTAAHLVRLRPRAVIVTNPPVFPGLVVAAYAAIAHVPFLLDNHTGGFGTKGNLVGRRLLGVTRWLARRAAAVMVTVPDYVRLVESWGGKGIVVHEAPPRRPVDVPPPHNERPRVFFVCVFAPDEPVAEVIGAARLLPEMDVLITGDVAKCPPHLLQDLPANVVLTGFLSLADYAAELARADVVLALTTEPTSIMRAAYEAVYARRALVMTDWPLLREVFPYAHVAANRAEDLATALRAAVTEDDTDRLERALAEQQERWAGQLAAMRQALGGRPA